ncbi:class I SAM-dependent methyltransferase [Aureibacter tunicatorum]|uniref:SAM-dependent methyltransferase n=1 Tax=Aureibacter tunicatorum TaxID=866807 RepID=A0AAE3XM14_9BACT|nr:class I SAM-dependent methyltransferase [Aureibacter tunicatorum]MDR6237409.1 SAM-dependent methyltransferase [Aureibacter tunicatorum]BDD06399.1 hypothetical protein AUTU_38820 [Aureibacter tunicatorum]
MTLDYHQINRSLGNMDLYLMDQLLKGRFEKEHRILDVGCGEGRNLYYFIQQGYEIYGIDQDRQAIKFLKMLSKTLNSDLDADCFIHGDASDMPYPPRAFDVVICNAVLHFAKDLENFMQMISELERVVKLEGSVFIRMAFDLDGMPELNEEFPFRLNRTLLEKVKKKFDFEEIEPFKTVLIPEMRSMATIILKKMKP